MPLLRSFRRAAPLVSSGAIVLACGAGDIEAPAGQTGEAIADGTSDTAHAGVVAIRIQYDGYNGLCTGSLIAQNLVLTARHCIAPTKPGAVACGTPAFQAPYPASASRVTTDANAMAAGAVFVAVAEVWVTPGDDACGRDLALLRLDGVGIDPKVATALTPRIDRAVSATEKYVAIGYGSTSGESTTGAGMRRSRDGLAVTCVGGACKSVNVVATEWRGATSTCTGDSGGPALDLDEKVVGVLSRSAPDCSDPEYGSVVAWREWLVEHALTAAERAGQAPPFWALDPLADAGSDAAAADAAPDAAGASASPTVVTSGCSLVSAAADGAVGPVGMAIAGLLAFRRRRRSRA